MNDEKFVEFELQSKKDSNIYLKGTVDLDTIDDLDGGDWEYEQNDGTYGQNIPTYWKTFNEDLTDDFHDLLNIIDWENFRQALCDFADENRTFDCGEYILHINGGANIENENVKCTFKVKLDFDESITAQGELDTSYTFCGEPYPIRWFDYGLKKWFPNNPFNPDFQRALYRRFEDLRNAVNKDLNNKLLNCLIENADKKVTINFGEYWVLINGGNK